MQDFSSFSLWRNKFLMRLIYEQGIYRYYKQSEWEGECVLHAEGKLVMNLELVDIRWPHKKPSLKTLILVLKGEYAF